jgi:hypothetical protein
VLRQSERLVESAANITAMTMESTADETKISIRVKPAGRRRIDWWRTFMAMERPW